MNRDWNDFKALNGNIAGAREAFENACETLFRRKYKDFHASKMEVRQGDGGIDIFIGELGVEPIIVIQCKFFLESFGNTQKAQIRDSFDTAVTSEKYELKEWILCLPRVIDIEENTWWFKWKHKKIKEHSKGNDFISIKNGNELIDLFKEHNLYNLVFKIEDSKKLSEIHEILVPKKITTLRSKNPNLVLFNNYTEKNEDYYLQRKEDVKFNQSISVSNIWLSGKSGVGKTALLNRNLIQSKTEYCFCDLSPVNIEKSSDVLSEILVSIEEKFDTERKTNEKNILKQISQILCQVNSAKIVIVIDELAISDENILKDIASDFIKLITHFSNQSVSDELKFVVSTISNPMDIVKNKSKASQFFHYICCDSWEEYASDLFDILSEGVGVDLADSKENIIQKCGNSPRNLKNVFRKIVASDDLRVETISNIIVQTLSEIVE